MSTPSRSRRYHRAVAIVGAWSTFYTRDLDPGMAGDRRDELASDLWEHGAMADQNRAGAGATARAILWRMALGMPADLSWRRASRTIGSPTIRSPFQRWERSGLLAAATVLGMLLFLGGLAVSLRVGAAAIRGQYVVEAESLTLLILSTAGALCGLALLIRRRTRSLGSLWLAISGVGIVLSVEPALLYTSATFQRFFFTTNVLSGNPFTSDGTSDLTLMLRLTAVGVAVFFLALAGSWLPNRTPRSRRVSTLDVSLSRGPAS